MPNRGGDPLKSVLIYDALFDDEAFGDLPIQLARSVGARSATIFWLHQDGAAEIMAHSQYFTDEQFGDYAANYAAADLWASAAIPSDRSDRVWNLDDLVPDRIYRNSRFYNDWIRGMGDDTFHCMGTSMNNRYGAGIIGVHRGKGAEQFDGGEVDKLAAMIPDLRRMLTIRGRLRAVEHRAAQAQGMLDAISTCAITVTGEGRLLHANAPGEALLANGGWVRLQDGCVCGCGTASATLATALLRATCATKPAATNLTLVNVSGKAQPVTVVPYKEAGGRRTALILAQPPRDDDVTERHLRSLFGLTPSEATVAVMIAEGMSGPAIAARRGTAYETIRAQTKAIASKLRCARQTDIAILVRALPLHC